MKLDNLLSPAEAALATPPVSPLNEILQLNVPVPVPVPALHPLLSSIPFATLDACEFLSSSTGQPAPPISVTLPDMAPKNKAATGKSIDEKALRREVLRIYNLPPGPIARATVDPQMLHNCTDPVKPRRRTPKDAEEPEIAEVVREDGSKLYACRLCERQMKRKADVRRHVRSIHLKVKAHTCSDCGKRFTREELITRHQHMRQINPTICARPTD
ncbi:MAG: hypothetical protein SGCHY_005385 [Lobulomycetales sp.]